MLVDKLLDTTAALHASEARNRQSEASQCQVGDAAEHSCSVSMMPCRDTACKVAEVGKTAAQMAVVLIQLIPAWLSGPPEPFHITIASGTSSLLSSAGLCALLCVVLHCYAEVDRHVTILCCCGWLASTCHYVLCCLRMCCGTCCAAAGSGPAGAAAGAAEAC